MTQSFVCPHCGAHIALPHADHPLMPQAGARPQRQPPTEEAILAQLIEIRERWHASTWEQSLAIGNVLSHLHQPHLSPRLFAEASAAARSIEEATWRACGLLWVAPYAGRAEECLVLLEEALVLLAEADADQRGELLWRIALESRDLPGSSVAPISLDVRARLIRLESRVIELAARHASAAQQADIFNLLLR